jgi:hypothetical protein
MRRLSNYIEMVNRSRIRRERTEELPRGDRATMNSSWFFVFKRARKPVRTNLVTYVARNSHLITSPQFTARGHCMGPRAIFIGHEVTMNSRRLTTIPIGTFFLGLVTHVMPRLPSFDAGSTVRTVHPK